MHLADSFDLIRVQGARENNLKDINIELPKRRLTVFTGVSGSGKSSLTSSAAAQVSADYRQWLVHSPSVKDVQPSAPADDLVVVTRDASGFANLEGLVEVHTRYGTNSYWAATRTSSSRYRPKLFRLRP